MLNDLLDDGVAVTSLGAVGAGGIVFGIPLERLSDLPLRPSRVVRVLVFAACVRIVAVGRFVGMLFGHGRPQ